MRGAPHVWMLTRPYFKKKNVSVTAYIFVEKIKEGRAQDGMTYVLILVTACNCTTFTGGSQHIEQAVTLKDRSQQPTATCVTTIATNCGLRVGADVGFAGGLGLGLLGGRSIPSGAWKSENTADHKGESEDGVHDVGIDLLWVTLTIESKGLMLCGCRENNMALYTFTARMCCSSGSRDLY